MTLLFCMLSWFLIINFARRNTIIHTHTKLESYSDTIVALFLHKLQNEKTEKNRSTCCLWQSRKLHPDEISYTVVLYLIMGFTHQNTIHTHIRHQLWTLNDTILGQPCCSIKTTSLNKQNNNNNNKSK
jgi:hypothetical protein